MESSHKAGLVKPSEWILLMFATVLLAAAFTHQRGSTQRAPVEAKMDIPADETSPVNDSNADSSADTKIVAVMARPLTEPATDISN